MASAAPSSRCDSDRFTAAMLAYWPELLRYCARFSESGDDAEDLAQATLIVAWHQRRRYRGDGSFKGWLLRIARTVGLRAIRSRQHQRDMNETLCNMAFGNATTTSSAGSPRSSHISSTLLWTCRIDNSLLCYGAT